MTKEEKQKAIDALKISAPIISMTPNEFDDYIKVPKKALKYRTAGMVAYNAEWLKNHFDIERAVICGAQQPCEDAISRKAVDELSKELVHTTRDKADFLCNFWEGLRKLPPVTPKLKTECSCEQIKWERDTAIAQLKELGYGLGEKPKTGHWEWVQYDYNPKLGNWHCSECRSIVVECVSKEEKGGIPLYKYCPQCGAKVSEIPTDSEKE